MKEKDGKFQRDMDKKIEELDKEKTKCVYERSTEKDFMLLLPFK